MFVRRHCYRCCWLLMPLLLLAMYASPAYADGGAPQLAYVAGAGPGIGIIDIARRHVTGTIALSGDPRTALLSPDGYALYVTQPGLGRVAVIIAKTGETLCTASLPGQPSLLALSLDATVLYVAGQGDTSVRALNPTTCAVERTFQTHEPVNGLAVTASTAPNATPSTPNQLWITGTTALTVFEVNGRLLGTVPVAGGPQNICIPGGFTAYVTTRQGTVVAIDLNTRRVLGTLLRGGQYGTMDYDAATGEVYVPDRQHNQLDVLTPVTAGAGGMPREPVEILHVGGAPQSVAITSDGRLGFVALSDGQVVMLDVPAHSIVTSITVGGTPHFIITGLYPPTSSSATVPQQTQTASSSPAPAQAQPTAQILLILLAAMALILAATAFWLLRGIWRKRG
jgi:DNA-binding beta-propeller fold protein YncE